MPLESEVNLIADLNEAWPTGSDPKNQGDDHIRNVKKAVKADDAADKARLDQLEADVAQLQLFVGLSADRIDWGYISSQGNINSGSGGFTVTKLTTGKYEINFTGGANAIEENTILCTCDASIGFTVAVPQWQSPNIVHVQTGYTSNNGAADLAWNFYRLVKLATP